MIYRLQVVSIVPAPQSLPVAMGDKAATEAGDWIRLNVMTWLIWTAKTTQETSDVFRRYLGANDLIVVIYANPKEAAGWAPQWVWNWINSKAMLHIPH
jgi:tellurite resistance-related uncharacterized protein